MASVKRKYSFNIRKLSSQRHSVFGGDLCNMTTEESLIPTVVDKLIQDIEFRGMKQCTEASRYKSNGNLNLGPSIWVQKVVKKRKNILAVFCRSKLLVIDRVTFGPYRISLGKIYNLVELITF